VAVIEPIAFAIADRAGPPAAIAVTAS